MNRSRCALRRRQANGPAARAGGTTRIIGGVLPLLQGRGLRL
jgi:hypothetical protein